MFHMDVQTTLWLIVAPCGRIKKYTDNSITLIFFLEYAYVRMYVLNIYSYMLSWIIYVKCTSGKLSNLIDYNIGFISSNTKLRQLKECIHKC